MPRRLRNRIACSPPRASRRAPCCSGAAEHAAVARLAAPPAYRPPRPAAAPATLMSVTAVGVADGTDALAAVRAACMSPRARARTLSTSGVALPEHDGGALQPRQLDRGVAGVVARRRVLLLVRPLVLLVDDDQAQVRLRREDRRRGADDHVVAARRGCRCHWSNSSPSVRPLCSTATAPEALARNGARSAASARSPAPGRSRAARADAPPRAPAGRPPSCRCP